MTDPSQRAHTSGDTATGEDWQAVAAALNDRMTACRVSQQELSQKCGISVATLRAIQHGSRGRRVQNKTLAAIARALDWPDDRLIRMLVRAESPTDKESYESDERQLRAIVTRIEGCLREMNEHLVKIERLVAGLGVHGQETSRGHVCRP